MKSFVKQVTKPVILMIICLIGLLVIFSTYTIQKVIASDIRQLSQDILQSKANEITQFFQSRIQEIEAMADIYDEQQSLETNLERMQLIDMIDNGYESLGIVDADGYKHVTTGAVFSVLNRDYYQELMESDDLTLISSPVESMDNHETIVIILTKVIRDQKVIGIVSGAVNLDYIQQVIDDSNTFNFFTTLYYEDEIVLFSGIQEPSFHRYRKPLEFKHWMVEMSIPDSFFYQRLIIVEISILLFSIFLLTLGIMIIKRVIIETVNPLHELAITMNQVDLNHLTEVELDAQSQEIHDLGESYNRMMRNISELIKELEEKERLKKDSEYKALIQQIKPHFLYNTLEMIQSMCLDYDDDKVENAIGLLARFFRISLSNDALMIPLNQELRQVESYLEIQLLRYHDRFEYRIENDLAAQPLMFLKFTLQPIVENAIYHGIKGMSRKGLILIQVKDEGEHILVEVCNDVETVDKKRLDRLNDLFQGKLESDQKLGYGMYNVNERLKLHFGEGIYLKVVFDEKRVKVICTHPKILEERYENIDC